MRPRHQILSMSYLLSGRRESKVAFCVWQVSGGEVVGARQGDEQRWDAARDAAPVAQPARRFERLAVRIERAHLGSLVAARLLALHHVARYERSLQEVCSTSDEAVGCGSAGR